MANPFGENFQKGPGPGALIHYGSECFNPAAFEKIQNCGRNKPKGGLWTCPVVTRHTWEKYCRSEQSQAHRLDCSFRGYLHPMARIFRVGSIRDLKDAPKAESTHGGDSVMDFELISLDHDAIWLTAKGLEACTDPVKTTIAGLDLFGWECEMVLILHAEAFLPAKKPKPLRFRSPTKG